MKKVLVNIVIVLKIQRSLKYHYLFFLEDAMQRTEKFSHTQTYTDTHIVDIKKEVDF